MSSLFHKILYILKGGFAKNERWYRLTAENKRFWSLLILLLYVASIRRKLLKTTYNEERSVHTNSESFADFIILFRGFHTIHNVVGPFNHYTYFLVWQCNNKKQFWGNYQITNQINLAEIDKKFMAPRNHSGSLDFFQYSLVRCCFLEGKYIVLSYTKIVS